MTKELKQKLQEILDSPNGVAIEVLLAYIIKKTSTDVDNKIVVNANEIADILSSNLKMINNLINTVTVKQAKAEAMVLVRWLAEQTETKWDDRAVAFLDMFI